MIPLKDWVWHGKAAHFIAAEKCLFHMATTIGEVVVSTVGEYRHRGELEEIGAGRLYETMVFNIIGICDCGCGMAKINPIDIDFDAYNDPLEAQNGHMAMCYKWAEEQKTVAG